MLKKLKETLFIIGLISIIILFALLFSQLRDCAQPKPQIVSEEFLVPTEVYRPPIIRLPFIKYKPPVPYEYLPIKPEDVSKTITITQIGETPVGATLVIDREGNIYTTTNFPEDVEVKVTEWKQKAFSLKPRFGYTLGYSGGIYHCFSLDAVRFHNFFLGCEIGFCVSDIKISEALIGLSVKYRIGSLELLGLRTDLQSVLGWNFMKDKVYGGISMKW